MRHALRKTARMIKQSAIVTMRDGYKVATTYYAKEAPVKGYIHVLHGMSEYRGRYERLATFFAEAGYAVVTQDHRGHGETALLNDSPLGHYGDEHGFEDVAADAAYLIRQFREKYALPRPILLGHSMGSLVARRVAELHSDDIEKAVFVGTLVYTPVHFAGHIVSSIASKWIGPREPANFITKLSDLMNNIKNPNSHTTKDWLSLDEANVQHYLNDPFCNYTSTNQFYADLTGGLKTITSKTEVAKIRKDLPVLFISGQEDPIGDYGKGVFAVANQLRKAGVQNVSVYLCERLRHEIFNEKEKNTVFTVILKWLEKE